MHSNAIDRRHYIALDFDGVLHHCHAGPHSLDFALTRHDRQKFLDVVNGRHPVCVPRVSYLEPDGCLFDREHNLGELLNRLPMARIVLATSWREHLPLAEMSALLSAPVRSRIMGVLPWGASEREDAGVRGRAMETWCQRHGGPDPIWIALDDQARHYSDHEDLLVQTHWRGLDGAAIDEAVRKVSELA